MDGQPHYLPDKGPTQSTRGQPEKPEGPIACGTPILRWAGSKRLLLPKLLEMAPRSFGRYIEPFCGSACFFLALNPRTSLLADLNHHLIATYRQIRRDPSAVSREMSGWRSSKKRYLALRASSPKRNTPQAAARFLYLNRFSFNGVYRENQNGRFNVPYGYGYRSGKLPKASSLQHFAKRLKTTALICSDFEHIVDRAKKSDFIYLDPPYHYGSSRNRGEYGKGAFTQDDFDRFVRAVKRASNRGAKILISYNKAHALQKKLKGWHLSYAPVRRSVSGFAKTRNQVREYLLRNY